MAIWSEIEEFVDLVSRLASRADLHAALEEIARRMGFAHFALTHHLDTFETGSPGIRLHNYPPGWADYFIRNRMGVSDPVHRASQRTSVGFGWRRIGDIVKVTPADLATLKLAHDNGLVDGFTVPANVPGEAHGSCSFVIAPGGALRREMEAFAQLVGAFAFECARRIGQGARGPALISPTLTDRQRDCVLWAARGKSDWEISRILAVSQETVIRHIKQARERYDVQKRSCLLIRTIYDGTISFADAFNRRYSHFWE